MTSLPQPAVELLYRRKQYVHAAGFDGRNCQVRRHLFIGHIVITRRGGNLLNQGLYSLGGSIVKIDGYEIHGFDTP